MSKHKTLPVGRQATAEELLDRFRDGNYHKRGGAKIMLLSELPEHVSKQLSEEAYALAQSQKFSDVTDPGHPTYWTKPHGEAWQFSLYNTTGRTLDTSTDHADFAPGKQFPAILEDFPAIQGLTQAVRSPELVNFRMNWLGPESRLSPHEEHIVRKDAERGVYLRLRFHLPVITHEGVDMLLDGQRFHLDAGKLYVINNGCVHDARNLDSNRTRVHFVWDMIYTRRIFAKFFMGMGFWHFKPTSEWRVKPLNAELEDPPYEPSREHVTYKQAKEHLQLMEMP